LCEQCLTDAAANFAPGLEEHLRPILEAMIRAEILGELARTAAGPKAKPN
jgi:hypothetical protein